MQNEFVRPHTTLCPGFVASCQGLCPVSFVAAQKKGQISLLVNVALVGSPSVDHILDTKGHLGMMINNINEGLENWFGKCGFFF